MRPREVHSEAIVGDGLTDLDPAVKRGRCKIIYDRIEIVRLDLGNYKHMRLQSIWP